MYVDTIHIKTYLNLTRNPRIKIRIWRVIEWESIGELLLPCYLAKYSAITYYYWVHLSPTSVEDEMACLPTEVSTYLPTTYGTWLLLLLLLLITVCWWCDQTWLLCCAMLCWWRSVGGIGKPIDRCIIGDTHCLIEAVAYVVPSSSESDHLHR